MPQLTPREGHNARDQITHRVFHTLNRSLSEVHAPILLAGILLIGLALRLPNLDYCFYGDELFSVLSESDELYTSVQGARYRPVFFTLLFLWKSIGFQGEWELRLLPMIFGLAQIPLIFLIGDQLGGRKLALTSAVLMATSPFQIEFSQELRMYSLVPMLALAQGWLLLLLLNRQTVYGWIGFVAIGTIGVYTHLLYWLFIAGLGVTFLRERRAIPLRRSITALGVVGLLYLPNISNLINFTEKLYGIWNMHMPTAIPKLFAAFLVGYNFFHISEENQDRSFEISNIGENAVLAVIATYPCRNYTLEDNSAPWK